MSTFYPLTVSSLKALTPNAVAISFVIPTKLKEIFTFDAGQHLTLKQTIGGKEVRRAYSISSSPKETEMTVGIKRVPGGAFSEWANKDLKEGDVIQVIPPKGHFVFKPASKPQHIAAFAAGSGITPIISIAKSVLESHSDNTFVLVYGNQNLQETMYHSELLDLVKLYTDRFFIQFLYSRANEADSLFGRIEASTVNLILKNKFKDRVFDDFYLCGPEDMINTVKDALYNSGIAKDHIHSELFTTSQEEEVSDLSGQTSLEVTLEDEVYSLVMDRKKLVLDAVLDEDIDAPYSCQGGVCSTCIARVTEGKAEMVKNQILTDSEIEEGFILTCQSHPITPILKIDYDDV
jgi:ring-1,2-phenylacetyl-CoA epoxidase subunit PaaE